VIQVKPLARLISIGYNKLGTKSQIVYTEFISMLTKTKNTLFLSKKTSLAVAVIVLIVAAVAVRVLWSRPVISEPAISHGQSLGVMAVEHSITTIWPYEDAKLSGTQTFKATMEDIPAADYNLYMKLEDQEWKELKDIPNEPGNKGITIDVPANKDQKEIAGEVQYRATAKDGDEIATKTLSVQIVPPSPSTSKVKYSAPKDVSSPQDVSVDNSLHVTPYVAALNQASLWASSRPADAVLIRDLASQPTFTWYGDWTQSLGQKVDSHVSAAAAQGKIPLLVAYNIPNRDCGNYSAGGAAGMAAYLDWVRAFASGLKGRNSIIILEPDALGQAQIDPNCLSEAAVNERFQMISEAVTIIKAHTSGKVYIDAGNSRWISAQQMAQRLNSSGIGAADGFSLNVANFLKTEENISYGTTLSALVGGKHFVIDTSRNGLGPASNGDWCNPPGRGLGRKPTRQTGYQLVDAFLWIKIPGESDGACNGGGAAGSWLPEYALGLAQRAVY
jgi:endoglucanase